VASASHYNLTVERTPLLLLDQQPMCRAYHCKTGEIGKGVLAKGGLCEGQVDVVGHPASLSRQGLAS
jgi:hypothetical protein